MIKQTTIVVTGTLRVKITPTVNEGRYFLIQVIALGSVSVPRYTVNALKFHTPKYPTLLHMQTADPDQTAPEGAVWSGSTLFAIPLFILRNN